MHHKVGERGALKYRYTGRKQDGEHLSGVPAANLYDADWDALPADLRREVERSAIYKPVEDEPAAESAPASQNKTAATSGGSRKAGGEDK